MRFRAISYVLGLALPMAAVADGTNAIQALRGFLSVSGPSGTAVDVPQSYSLKGEDPNSPGSFCEAKILVDGGPNGQIHLSVDSDGERRLAVDLDPETAAEDFSSDKAGGTLSMKAPAQLSYYTLPGPTKVKKKITIDLCRPKSHYETSIVTCSQLQLQTLTMGRTDVQIEIDPTTKQLKAVMLAGIFPNERKNKPITVVCRAPQAHTPGAPNPSEHSEEVHGTVMTHSAN